MSAPIAGIAAEDDPRSRGGRFEADAEPWLDGYELCLEVNPAAGLDGHDANRLVADSTKHSLPDPEGRSGADWSLRRLLHRADHVVRPSDAAVEVQKKCVHVLDPPIDLDRPEQRGHFHR